MKFKSLQTRLAIIFGLCLLVTVGAVMIYGAVTTKNTETFVTNSSSEFATTVAKDQLLEKARAIAFEIDAELEVALDTARILADVLSGIKDQSINLNIDRDKINAILRSALIKNETFMAVYSGWEPNALDELDDLYMGTEGYDQTGRYIPYWNRSEDGETTLVPLKDYENTQKYDNDVRKGDYYLFPRERERECAIDPYPMQGRDIWITSLVVPIMADDTFYGIAGVDMRLDFIQSLVERANQDFYFGAGKMAIVSHNGILAAASNNVELVGKHLRHWISEDWQEHIESIHEGQEEIKVGDDNIHVLVPLRIGRTEAPWAVIIEIPEVAVLKTTQNLIQELKTRAKQNLSWQIGVGLGITLIALLVIWSTSRSIVTPLIKGIHFARAVAEGDLSATVDVKQQDEVGVLAKALRNMKERIQNVLKETNGLIQAVQEGRLDSRGNAEAFAGGWRDLVVGVNSLIDAFMTPINVTAECLDRIAKGNIPDRITDEYEGDFNEIKNNVNTLIDVTNEITQLTEEIACGNLLVDARERSGHDRLMKALNTMIKRLNEVVMNVKSAADSVASGSQGMNSSSAEMSQGAAEQAAAAEEAAASMEQMAANIRQNADNALQTEKIARKAAEDAQEGGKAVADAVNAMKDIAKKIKIVEEIASQTHMLSLNATIEAAKAQEQGKGFAVVASEVRALAERSRIAAEEIKELASSSVGIAGKAGEMLNKLVPDIQKTAELVQEISAASNEQSSGAGQVNRAIQQLDQVIQQNVTTSEEMASTAEELESQADHLQNTIAFFKIRKRTILEKEQDKRGAKRFLQRKNDNEIAILEEEDAFDEYPIDIDMIEEQEDAQDAEFERY
jgi:methyl-accepting chemotaxis protein